MNLFVSHNYDPKISLDKQLQNSGIVVFSVYNGDDFSESTSEYNEALLSFLFQNEDEDSSYRSVLAGISSSKLKSFFIGGPRLDILLFDPGEYCLKSVTASIARTRSVWSERKPFRFKVNRGEVIYIGDILFFPSMRNVVVVDNFEKSKNIDFAENTVKILSAVNNENLSQIDALSEELK